MIDLNNHTTLNIALSQLENIAKSLTQQTIELIIVDAIEMQSLNYEHRSQDKSTDVLSFPLVQASDMMQIPSMPLGSIIICEDAVLTVSKALGHSIQEEFSLLFIHGLLHLLGFDHETDHGEMREKEASLIMQFGLPESLIIRTQH